MLKFGPIATLVMLALALAANGLGIYLKVRGTLSWGNFAGWMACTLTLAGLIGWMVWSDIRRARAQKK